MDGIDARVTRLMIFVGGLSLFLLLEWFVPYRTPTVSKVRRWFINLSLAGANSVILMVLFGSAMAATLVYGASRQWGLLYTVALPFWAKIIVSVVILDFLLYLWHVLNHEAPFFWRFHRVHHSDLNMDVATATRFHIGELAMSAVIRMAVILLLGVGWLELLVFDGLVLLCTQFHHSSLKVPLLFERLYWVLFVPPSMHRIHHSVIIKERNTNYGAIFSVWDRVFGTLLKQVDQAGIRIGIGAYPRQEELNLYRLLIMPFTRPVK
jgi:sterol desaturase/sphingolipid hydroxylase (fatty acid hydroxylase superfamily)